MINHDQLALDHFRGTPIDTILARHEISIADYHHWLHSPEAILTLNQLRRIHQSRTPSPDELRAIARQGLAALASSGKATESVRKACHDLRQLADEQDADPEAEKAANRYPNQRTFTKEELPRYLHECLDRINEVPPEGQPGAHSREYWNFDPDDPESIARAEQEYGWG